MTETPAPADALRALDARLRAHAFGATENHEPIAPGASGPGPTQEFVAGVRAMAMLERSTIPRLRRMLVSPTHTNARLTAFFSTWAYERYWIADRLDQLAAAGADNAVAPADRSAQRAALRRDRRERVRLLGAAIATNLIGAPMVAVHVLQCLIDEWATDEAYAALAAGAPDPGSARVLAGIRRVKAEHAEILRLALAVWQPRQGRGRRLLVLALRRIGWPSQAAPAPDQIRAVGRLLGRSATSLDRIAERIGALGLGDHRPVLAGPSRTTVLRIRRVR